MVHCSFFVFAIFATLCAQAELEPSLLRWFARNGGYLNPAAHVTHNSFSGSRSLVATNDLANGEVILRTPLSLVLNIEHALVGDVGRAGFVDDLNDPQAMALFLCHQAMPSERSTHLPYIISALRSPATPLTLSERLLDSPPWEYIKHDAIRMSSAVRGTFEHIKRMQGIDRVFTIVGTNSLQGSENEDGRGPSKHNHLPLLSEELFARAVAVVQSRIIGLQVKNFHSPIPSEQQQQQWTYEWAHAYCLVPLADMINTGECPPPWLFSFSPP
jgi:hypothetical protein